MTLDRLSVEITYTNDTKVTYNDVEEAKMTLERLRKHEYIELSDVKQIKITNGPVEDVGEFVDADNGYHRVNGFDLPFIITDQHKKG